LAAGLTGPLQDYVTFDESMVRPAEVDLLIGDATRAKEKLGWSPSTSFQELVNLMLQNDLELEAKIR
jgi:GDPmannose 4,6-dehydratase